MINDLFASAVGTSIAELVTLPICIIKTNYQTNLSHKSIIECTKSVYHQHGLRIFYTSSYSAIFSQVVSTSTKYTFYHNIKHYRQTKDNDILNNMLNGTVGGIMGSLLAHPFDVMKILQQQKISYLNEYRKIGYKLIYRGYTKSFAKTITLACLLFPTYDFYKSKIDKYENIPNKSIVASIMTTLSINLFTQPIDYLKVRGVSNLEMYSHKNIFHYYRGFHLNLMRTMPHFTITMYITEKVKKYMNK